MLWTPPVPSPRLISTPAFSFPRASPRRLVWLHALMRARGPVRSPTPSDSWTSQQPFPGCSCNACAGNYRARIARPIWSIHATICDKPNNRRRIAGRGFCPDPGFPAPPAPGKARHHNAAHQRPSDAFFQFHEFSHSRSAAARRSNTLLAYYLTIVTCIRTDSGIAFLQHC